MALRFRELPWYFQTLLFFAVAVALFVAGEWFEFSPVKGALDQRAEMQAQLQQLRQEVSRLELVKQRHQEFLTDLEARRRELETLRQLVPEEKETDQFMRLLQSGARNTQVSLRRLTSRDVVFREYHAEVPFELELDGGYYSIKDFFQRLRGSTRIVNASSLQLQGIDTARGQYTYAPGTTVAGVCVVTTFYTPSEEELAAAAPPAAGGAPPRRR